MVRRKMWLLGALCAGAALFQLFPTSCAQFGLNQFATALDFCSVLNCSASTFFDFCSPIATLVDCPTVTP